MTSIQEAKQTSKNIFFSHAKPILDLGSLIFLSILTGSIFCASESDKTSKYFIGHFCFNLSIWLPISVWFMFCYIVPFVD